MGVVENILCKAHSTMRRVRKKILRLVLPQVIVRYAEV